MKPLVHLVRYFVSGIGRTLCGRYSEHLTADPRAATCRACRRYR